MPELKQTTHKSTTEQVTEVFHVQVTDDLHVVKRLATKTTSASNWEEERVSTSTQEGFVTDEGLKALLRGDAPGNKISKNKYKILSADHLEFLHREGFSAFFWEKKSHRKPLIEKDLLNAFVEGKWSVEDLYRCDMGDDQINRLDGTPIPTAQHGDYLFAGLSEAKYNLELAVEILSSRDDVRIVPDPFNGNLIQDIPGYNSEPGKRRCIEIIYSPSAELFSEILKGSSLDFWENVFELDALGLRRGGAALYECFRDERQPPAEDDEHRF